MRFSNSGTVIGDEYQFGFSGSKGFQGGGVSQNGFTGFLYQGDFVVNIFRLVFSHYERF